MRFSTDVIRLVKFLLFIKPEPTKFLGFDPELLDEREKRLYTLSKTEVAPRVERRRYAEPVLG